jgi:Protein of unknown function (DUF3809)
MPCAAKILPWSGSSETRISRNLPGSVPRQPGGGNSFCAKRSAQLATRWLGDLVEAVLVIPAPMVGEQQVDFASILQATSDGATLSALERSGNAWAEVWGEAKVSTDGEITTISYHLRVVAHLKLPLPEHWGGRTFAKMAESAAAQMLPRIAEDFPRGLRAAMPTAGNPGADHG